MLTACLLGHWSYRGVPFSIDPGMQALGEPSLTPRLDRHKGEEAESRERASEGREEGEPGSSRSELGGAAGVALQQTHDGRVAFGSADELLQGQLACGATGAVSGRRPRESEGVWRPPRPAPAPSPSLFVSIWRKIFSVLFSGVDSSSGIFITDETIL